MAGTTVHHAAPGYPPRIAQGKDAMPVATTTRWLAIARRHPSAWLLAAQLIAVLLYPALDDTAAGRAALGMFGMAVLGLALWVVQRSPLGTWLALLLAIPSVVFSLAGALLDRSALLTTAQLLESLLYFYTAGALIAYMLQDHRVTRDELFAAGATFTLLAWGSPLHSRCANSGIQAVSRARRLAPSAAGWSCFI